MSYELTNEEWSKLKALLLKKKMGRPCLDLRRTLSGIKWILKTIPKFMPPLVSNADRLNCW